MEPDRGQQELTVVAIHPGVTREQIADSTGWKVKFAAKVADTPPPTAQELEVLRDLHARTKAALQADNELINPQGIARSVC